MPALARMVFMITAMDDLDYFCFWLFHVYLSVLCCTRTCLSEDVKAFLSLSEKQFEWSVLVP